jgi:SpoVK/Ycf46/Vps4 family AAA+-type ATPase
VVTINNPEEAERLKMLTLFTKDWDVSGVTFDRAVKVSEGLSGSHVKDLCLTAAMKAIVGGSLNEEGIAVVTDAHFEAAVNEVKNKDYSSYMEAQSKKEGRRGMGFNSSYDDSMDY